MNDNRRSTKPNVLPASGRFHEPSNRVDNNFWLIDVDAVTGLLREDLAATSRQPDLVALQLSPRGIGSSRARHHHNGNRQFTSRAPDFRGALPNMEDLVGGRLISGGT